MSTGVCQIPLDQILAWTWHYIRWCLSLLKTHLEIEPIIESSLVFSFLSPSSAASITFVGSASEIHLNLSIVFWCYAIFWSGNPTLLLKTTGTASRSHLFPHRGSSDYHKVQIGSYHFPFRMKSRSSLRALCPTRVLCITCSLFTVIQPRIFSGVQNLFCLRTLACAILSFWNGPHSCSG